MDPLAVDGLAYDPDENVVVMLLADGLDWSDETEHLLLLQKKINAYAAFIEQRQYEKVYPGITPDHAVIQLMFAEPITENCWKFVQTAAAQLNDELGIIFKVSTDEE